MEAVEESADVESGGLTERKPLLVNIKEGQASAPQDIVTSEGLMVAQEGDARPVFQESEEVQARKNDSAHVHHHETMPSHGLADLQREASPGLTNPHREASSPISGQSSSIKSRAENSEEKSEELLPFNELESAEDYVKKGFKCANNTEDEEDDEQLREYWSRTLQSRSSTGEIVEEIVKVLKHRQKTHDLLCPVCGSCVTKRVILRKRKRSSLISVDRWYRDSIEEDTEMQAQEGLTDYGDVGDQQGGQPTDEYEDTEAFGCMACFSLFFQKGQQIWNWVGGDGLSETVSCLPFFFPPYPWGLMNQVSTKSGSLLSGTSELPEAQEQQATDADTEAGFTCGLGSALVPQYPWGMMQQQLSEGLSLAPKFPWGRMHQHESEEVSQKPEVEEVTSDIVSVVKNEPMAEVILQPMDEASVSQMDKAITEEAYQKSGEEGLVTDLPPTSQDQIEESQPICDDTTAISSEENVQSWTGEICACGLGAALLPDYAWGTFPEVEAVDGSKPSYPLGVQKPPEDSTPMKATSMGETSAAAQTPVSEESNCADGLAPCLLPVYPWGSCQKDEEIIEEVPVLTRWRREKDDELMPSQNGSHSLQDVASVVLPPYPWGTCSVVKIDHDASADVWKTRRKPTSMQQVHKSNGDASAHNADNECACGLCEAVFPKYPWGSYEIQGAKEVKTYAEQETKIEARITSKTDVFTVISTKKGYIGEKLPDELKNITPQKTTKTIESVNLDQRVTVVDASIILEERPQLEVVGSKGSLESIPSTGFALLDWESPDAPETGVLTKRPSTGYADASAIGALRPLSSSHAHLEEIEEALDKDSHGPAMHLLPPQKVQVGASMTGLVDTRTSIAHAQSVQASSAAAPSSAKVPAFGDQSASVNKPGGLDIPNFSWVVGKVSQDDLTMPLLKDSLEGKEKTFISVLEPSGGIEEDQSKFLSVFKVSKPSDDEGLLAPLLSPVSATGEKQLTSEGVHVVVEERPQVVVQNVGQVQPSGLASAQVVTDVVEPARRPQDASDGWDILKPIVYGGLDISIASLGVTSSAAGGNAITRTVVYMGLATLLSGLIGFYHNVLNLYHYHKDHYTDIVGVTLLLHGTVALISYVVFGVVSPLTYALSYRESDDRDKKFIRCCIVTTVCVFLLSLGKAKVSKKRYFRTVVSYLVGGVLAAIIGYLAGEHVAELLEEWGL